MCCPADCNRSRPDPKDWIICGDCEEVTTVAKPVTRSKYMKSLLLSLIMITEAIVGIATFYYVWNLWPTSWMAYIVFSIVASGLMYCRMKIIFGTLQAYMESVNSFVGESGLKIEELSERLHTIERRVK